MILEVEGEHGRQIVFQAFRGSFAWHLRRVAVKDHFDAILGLPQNHAILPQRNVETTSELDRWIFANARPAVSETVG